MKKKKCTICFKTKPATNKYFALEKRTVDGLRCQCKDCVNKKSKKYRNKRKTKDFHLKMTFGISIGDYEDLLIAQNNCCAICGINNDKTKKDLDVDHNHKNGSIRGLLCNKCNQLLGYCNENIMILDSAIAYLYFNKMKKNE